jgi:membrane protease YdiL (CAAX protease family)
MTNTMQFIIVLIAIFSYTFLDYMIPKVWPKSEKKQLWSGNGAFLWGGILLVTCFILRQSEYVFKLPINHQVGIQIIILVIIGTIHNGYRNKKTYYPSKSNMKKCLNYSIFQPIFEEIAFRGLLLPVTINLFSGVLSSSWIISLNAIAFTLFHRNYWGFCKEHINNYYGFFFVGLMLTYTAYENQSIVYAIVAHILINGTNTLYGNWKEVRRLKNIQA